MIDHQRPQPSPTDGEISLLLATVVGSSIAGAWLGLPWVWTLLVVPWLTTTAVALWLSVRRRPHPCYKPPV